MWSSQGLTEAQFADAATAWRAGTSQIDGELVVQGSRTAGTPNPGRILIWRFGYRPRSSIVTEVRYAEPGERQGAHSAAGCRETESADIGRVMMYTTAKLLYALWDAGLRAVVACDFNDELPWAQGIRRPGQIASS